MRACLACVAAPLLVFVVAGVPAFAASDSPSAQSDRSPVDVALSPDGAWLLSANQTSHTATLVRVADGKIVGEYEAGRQPAFVAWTPDGASALVTAKDAGELRILALQDGSLTPQGIVSVGSEPHGVAVSPDGRSAYVALARSNEVVVVSLASRTVEARIAVGRWPRYLALSPDGARLAVGCSGDGGIWVVDTAKRASLFESKFVGLNIGHLQSSPDGKYVYFPWMVYADRPITAGNIREGWVLGNRIARVRLDEPARREAIALDPRGRAVADPHGLALSPDGEWLVASASGTHELVVLRLGDLPLRPDGPGDHMKRELAADRDRFFRIPLGGRPMGLRFAAQGSKLYVANYLENSIQEVDIAERRVARTIALGSAVEPSLARQGEAIFHDALRSADGWYSCHSCHYDGGTNAVTMDTKNDGSFGTYKMVLSLHNIQHTGPWFWHGWQNDLKSAVAKSLGDTMQGPPAMEGDVAALLAYLETLGSSRQSASGGPQSAAEVRGRAVFEGATANCASCHSGPYFTDGQIHDVGLKSDYDAYDGFNTPSLVDAGNRARYLHHGRALSLDDLLVDLHSPTKVSGTRELTDEERSDLIAYLRSL